MRRAEHNPEPASPAQARVHSSSDRTSEKWIPAGAGTAKFLALALYAVSVQGGSLAAFVLVSRTSIADFGKPIVIGLATGGMAALVGYAALRISDNRVRFGLMPATLALGYVAAWGLLARVWFPGLMKDMDFRSIDYWFSVGGVLLFLFMAYVTITALAALTRTGLHRARGASSTS